jgi:hypothetical protein
VVAEFLTEELQETAAVGRFLDSHAVEDGRRRWKILVETLGEVRVDPLVFLFERDSQRQDFSFSKAVEIPHMNIDALTG